LAHFDSIELSFLAEHTIRRVILPAGSFHFLIGSHTFA